MAICNLRASRSVDFDGWKVMFDLSALDIMLSRSQEELRTGIIDGLIKEGIKELYPLVKTLLLRELIKEAKGEENGEC